MQTLGQFLQPSETVELLDGGDNGIPLGLRAGVAEGFSQRGVRNINRRFHASTLARERIPSNLDLESIGRMSVGHGPWVASAGRRFQKQRRATARQGICAPPGSAHRRVGVTECVAPGRALPRPVDRRGFRFTISRPETHLHPGSEINFLLEIDDDGR